MEEEQEEHDVWCYRPALWSFPLGCLKRGHYCSYNISPFSRICPLPKFFCTQTASRRVNEGHWVTALSSRLQNLSHIARPVRRTCIIFWHQNKQFSRLIFCCQWTMAICWRSSKVNREFNCSTQCEHGHDKQWPSSTDSKNAISNNRFSNIKRQHKCLPCCGQLERIVHRRTFCCVGQSVLSTCNSKMPASRSTLDSSAL